MKIRTGFVSNSSSSSFCIWKGFMTNDQIVGFREIINSVRDKNSWDETSIGEDGEYFIGTLDMHNETVLTYLNAVGLKRGKWVEYS